MGVTKHPNGKRTNRQSHVKGCLVAVAFTLGCSLPPLLSRTNQIHFDTPFSGSHTNRMEPFCNNKTKNNDFQAKWWFKFNRLMASPFSILLGNLAALAAASSFSAGAGTWPLHPPPPPPLLLGLPPGRCLQCGRGVRSSSLDPIPSIYNPPQRVLLSREVWNLT